MNSIESRNQYQNEYEASALKESVEVGIAQLPADCIKEVHLNEQGLDLLSDSDRAKFTKAFFMENTFMSIPLEGATMSTVMGQEHCRQIFHDIDPVWCNGIQYSFLGQKGPGLTGYFYENSTYAYQWLYHFNDPPIGLEKGQYQQEDTIASTALVEEQFRGSLNLSTLILYKGKTYKWLNDQWKNSEYERKSLIFKAFNELSSNDQLATGFRLEANTRRLKNIHRYAPKYSANTNRFHIAQGAQTLLEECQFRSPRILETLELSGQPNTTIEPILFSLSQFEEIHEEQLASFISHICALTAQDARAIHRVNAKKNTGAYIKAHDISADRNTDMALTKRDFDESLVRSQLEIGDPNHVINYFINQSANSLVSYLLLLTSHTQIRDLDVHAFQEKIQYDDILIKMIRHYTTQIL